MKRESIEEAGIEIKLTGILKVEFYNKTTGGWLRVIYLAEPVNEE